LYETKRRQQKLLISKKLREAGLDPPPKNHHKELIINEILVEAAGVEPASENVTGQETTCVVAFLP
jgi:hypothetical protein